MFLREHSTTAGATAGVAFSSFRGYSNDVTRPYNCTVAALSSLLQSRVQCSGSTLVEAKMNQHVELQLAKTHQGILHGHRYASLVANIKSTLRPPPGRTL